MNNSNLEFGLWTEVFIAVRIVENFKFLNRRYLAFFVYKKEEHTLNGLKLG